MDNLPSANPFVPGRGQIPPYLAGRDAEQSALKDLLAYLNVGRGAPREAVLSGPRGNGKTVLLRWLQKEIEAANSELEAILLTPDEISSVDQLATALVPPRRFATLLPDSFALSVGIGKLGWDLAAAPGSLTALLTARCRRRPLVLLLDEAHTLDGSVGRSLLNASQRVSSEAPFLVVLAGTPGLHAHLNTMSATFWSRAAKLGIGPLDKAAAAAALTRPFSAMTPAVDFVESTLRHVLEEGQGYPYFLQLWGAAIWTAAKGTGAERIDETVVADARPAFKRERTAYYEDRREELEAQDLIQVAAHVAATFDGRDILRGRELNAAISAVTGAQSQYDILRCRERLATVGFVWKPPESPDLWQPGIPSLMDYIQTCGV